MDRNTELSEFLRTRRARLRPEDAGVSLTTSGPRRVPGLRREELAQLAGVSTDYYTRLEQGRHLNVSEAVLDAVARALRLNDTERAYLFELAKPRPRRTQRRRPPRPQRVRPGVYRLLQTLDAAVSPAFVLGRRSDVLASNRLARALIVDFDALPYRERNMIRFMFLDPAARELYGEWENYASEMVAGLRLQAGRNADDPVLTELVGELTIKSPEFRTWWADHNVREKTHGVKVYHHPLVGEMTLSYENVAFPGDADQALCIYTVEPGSPSEEALRLLANWTAPSPDRPAAPSSPSLSPSPPPTPSVYRNPTSENPTQGDH
ncbi:MULTISPECIES: helix-turn-helix transcriptional regulator [Streptomyces]|uniref:Helix-turn-helix transcriptional regulator n=1 Tax=Streptomyces lonegramiae TaxID=3075524 RepID=A0ABU2XP38_9ACTN|nr:helix-turn-helix transcriptional regulator [Streptomyces sp. DSM 41529]MDT0546835.1 helix-turn-helix transcriptional regulator [Streptomyces sp. DSM 41529]